MSSKDERLEIRLGDALLDRIDAWRKGRAPSVSRPEAIRQLTERGLRETDPIALSDGEKLIAFMLCNMTKGTGAQQIADAELIRNSIRGGHYWALDWQFPSLFGRHQSSRAQAAFVSQTLEMWCAIERSHARLSRQEKDDLTRATGIADAPEFPGWGDGPEEVYVHIARFILDNLKLYMALKGRSDRRSPVPTTEGYRRMLERYEAMRQRPKAGELTTDDLIELLTARDAADQD